MNLHDVLKNNKNGYGKVTDHVCREIRHKRISKVKGLNLINYYSSQKPLYLDLFCDWFGTKRGSLDFIINDLEIINSQKKDNNYKSMVFEDMKPLGFTCNDDLARNYGIKMINVGKGYP